MDDGSRASWIVIGLLLLGAIFFAVAETAFASVSRTNLKTNADRGNSRAAKALYIKDRFDEVIPTILIGTNITHMAIATLVTVVVTRRWGFGAVGISTIITTIAVFFLGEMLPKSIARKYSERFSMATAGLLRFFMLIFKPGAIILNGIGQKVSHMLKREPEITVTEDELYDIIEEMKDEGFLDENQGSLVSAALRFGDVAVESVLTSRADMAAIDIAMSNSDILDYVRNQMHSRFPVYEGDVDHIIGILQIRTYIKAYLREGDALDVRSLLDEAYFIHMSTEIDDLLPVMSKKRLNMAIVMDNFGGTLGVVTVEDILEKLVGDIWDEDDTVYEDIVVISDTMLDVDAGISVGELFEKLDHPFEEDEDDEEMVNTLMGQLCYEEFRHLPEVGDAFDYQGLRIEIAKMDHNRILRLLVSVIPPDEALDAEGGEDA